MALQYLHIFNPKLVNEFRFGANLEHVQQLSTLTNTGFTIESLGINGMKVGGPNGRPLKPNEEGFPLLNISGYIGIGSDLAASNLDGQPHLPIGRRRFLDEGKACLHLCAYIRYIQDNATTNNWPFGQIYFTGDITGDPAADFLLGYPKTTLTPEGVPITKARQWRSAEYVQDNWKVRPNLTINAGLRYDIFAPPIDVNGVTRTLDFSSSPVLTFTRLWVIAPTTSGRSPTRTSVPGSVLLTAPPPTWWCGAATASSTSAASSTTSISFS